MTDPELRWLTKLWRSARPAKEGRIEEFEKIFGRALPISYRDCVAKYQGMVPSKTLFDFHEKGHEQTTVMGLLFHFADPAEENSFPSFSVAENYKRLIAYLPPNFLAISEDPGGNPIALRFDEGTGNAEVVYIDLESDDLESAVSFVASDFPAFLSMLRNDTRYGRR